MDKGRRVLGAHRQVDEVVPSTSGSDANTKFSIGDDSAILMDEVLNNTTRAVLVFDEFSDRFTDFEMYQLSVAFKYNKSIVAVTMSGVNVGDEGVTLLCQALVRSNVQYIDLTNTPLDDEAGMSLAALARCNRNLRTVIVTDTLISEEIMDEIDLACQINESTGDPDPIPPVQSDTRYCVAHLFDACPNGNYCLYSHALTASSHVDQRQLDADWERALPPPPREGATWRDDSDEPRQLRIDLSKIRRPNQQQLSNSNPNNENAAAPPKRVSKGGRKRRSDDSEPWIVVGALAVVAVAITLTALLVTRRTVKD